MSGEKPYPTAPPMSYPSQLPAPGGYGAPAYPAQYSQAQYPSGYPGQQPPYTSYPTSQPGAMPGMYYEAPPPYGAPSRGPPPPYQPYPNQGMQQPPYQQPQQGVPMPQPQNVFVPNAFDAGARFDGIAQPRIPPPPPGVAPNMAQMAAMQGHNVTATQQRGGWLEGTGGGGFSWGF